MWVRPQSVGAAPVMAGPVLAGDPAAAREGAEHPYVVGRSAGAGLRAWWRG